MKKTGAIITAITVVISLVAVVLWQLFVSDSINYYVVCTAVLVLSLLPFFVSFEVQKISPREIALVSTLIALAVVSRAAFYLIPQFKPIVAVVIVSAVCLGAERGYIVGAFSMFISNFIFGQGYWTPFQMVAMGLVGLIAGCVFRVIRPHRVTLALVGFFLATVIYGAVADLSTVLFVAGVKPTLSGAVAVYSAGLPFSLVLGAATAVFLFIFGDVFVRKINRITTKFGLLSKTPLH